MAKGRTALSVRACTLTGNEPEKQSGRSAISGNGPGRLYGCLIATSASPGRREQPVDNGSSGHGGSAGREVTADAGERVTFYAPAHQVVRYQDYQLAVLY